MSDSIPIIVYHSVCDGERIDLEMFKTHIKTLKASPLPLLTRQELDRSRKGIMVTFDDGFVDLWTHVLDLLKRYQIPVLVFPIVSRIGEGPPRSRGGRAYPHSSSHALADSAMKSGSHPAFLRWSELQALESTGLVQVQSHSYEHQMGWSGSKPVGFNLGDAAGNKAHWSLAQATGGDTRLGIPLYPRASALANRIYRDDVGLRDVLASYLDKLGGESYVAEVGGPAVSKTLLHKAHVYLEEKGDRGVWETEGEREERILLDLSRAREILESRLEGVRDELCLPWGQFDDVTLACARKVGIRRIYTMGREANPAGKIGLLANRFGPMRPTNGGGWLRRRLWLYRSTMRAGLYARYYGLRPRDVTWRIRDGLKSCLSAPLGRGHRATRR